jgi:hypothetical protein
MARPLNEIARDISRDWTKMNYAAKPYVQAMSSLKDMKDMYMADTAQDIVLRFLNNASTWRGNMARSVKLELKQMLRDNGYNIK